jgi:hypothetical protein
MQLLLYREDFGSVLAKLRRTFVMLRPLRCNVGQE